MIVPVGSTKTFWEWDVDDNGNNSLPFSFRIVNAEGTDEELTGGGFYTGQFWVRNESNQVSSISSTVSVVTTSSSTTSSKTTSTRTSTSSLFATSGSSPFATSSVSQSMSSEMPTTAPAPSLASVENNESDTTEDGDGTNTTAIGTGVGVGAGIVLMVSAIGVWIFYHRRRRADKQQHTNPSAMLNSKETDRVHEAYAPSIHQMEARNPYPQGEGIHEFAAKSPVEAPGEQRPFGELAGSGVKHRSL